jgi:hypothetical protein
MLRNQAFSQHLVIRIDASFKQAEDKGSGRGEGCFGVSRGKKFEEQVKSWRLYCEYREEGS